MTRADRLVLLAVSLVVLLPGVFGVSLTDRDEGAYAQVSREMGASGDWLVPRYLGQPWIFKPPLLYWFTAAAFHVFGLHAWAGRLVSVLAMVGVVQLLTTFAAEGYGRRAALLAGVTFITAGLPAVVGKLLLTDALLLVFCLGACVAVWRMATRGVRLSRAVVFWLCVALAVLAKGPTVLLFVGPFALALLVRRETRGWIGNWVFWLTSPICAAIGGPWFVWVAIQEGGALWYRFLWIEIVLRLVRASCGHAGPPGYHVAAAVLGWQPWTLLVPGAVAAAWAARKADALTGVLLIWCGVPWLVLELMATKLPHYALPCYVPLAILVGRTLDRGLAGGQAKWQRVILRVWAGLPVAFGAGLLALPIIARGAMWSLGLCVTGVVLVVGFLLAARAIARRGLLAGWTAATMATGLCHVVVGCWVLPALEPYRLSRQVAETANELAGPATEVVVCGYEEPSVFFYLRASARVASPSELPALLGDDTTPRVLAVRDTEFRAAGLESPDRRPGAHRLVGFNYVKGQVQTVWIVATGRRPADPDPGPDEGQRSSAVPRS